MIEGELRGLATTAGSFEEAGLNQIRFMDIFEGTAVFLHCGCQGLHPDWSSGELVDDGQKNLTIHLIKPCCIDTQPGKRILSDSLSDLSSRLHLSIVAYPLDQSIHNTRSSSRTTGNFARSIGIDGNSKHSC